jgi:hypothetical protein
MCRQLASNTHQIRSQGSHVILGGPLVDADALLAVCFTYGLLTIPKKVHSPKIQHLRNDKYSHESLVLRSYTNKCPYD